MKAQRGSRGLSLTSALCGDGWSKPCPGRFTPPGEDLVPMVLEAGCAPGPVWMGAENLAPTGIQSLDFLVCSESAVQLVREIFHMNISYGS